MKRGRLIMFVGKPYTGKSTKLIKLANSFFKVKGSILLIKPIYADQAISRDVRYKHRDRIIATDYVPTYDELYDHIREEIRYVFIDEVQLFDQQKNVLEYLNRGITVYASGLISNGNVFLMRRADKIVPYTKDMYDYNKAEKDVYVKMNTDKEFYSYLAACASADPFKVALISYKNDPSKAISENIDIGNYHWVTNSSDAADFISQIRIIKQKNDILPTAEEMKNKYNIHSIFIDKNNSNMNIDDAIDKYCRAGISVYIR